MVRRTIPELTAKYRLNPLIRDVFVEGRFDRMILRWFFDAVKLKDVTVVQIQLVEVPDALAGC